MHPFFFASNSAKKRILIKITTQLASITEKKVENGVIYLMCDNIGHAHPLSDRQTFRHYFTDFRK